MQVALRTRAFLDGALGRLRRASYLKKWSILGVAIGLVAGFGAVIFVKRSACAAGSCSR